MTAPIQQPKLFAETLTALMRAVGETLELAREHELAPVSDGVRHIARHSTRFGSRVTFSKERAMHSTKNAQFTLLKSQGLLVTRRTYS